jgi:hypothetical protein
MKKKTISIFISVLVLMSLLISALPAQAAGNTWIVNGAIANNAKCNPTDRICKTIQSAINAASDEDTILIRAGTYVENIVVNKSLTLIGPGSDRVIIYPAISGLTCPPDSGSICDEGSNIILVQANDVTISGLTLDGDNPNLTSGVVRGGKELDARNGIITNHSAGTFNGLKVTNVIVKNIYLRGIYASSGGTFDIQHNYVKNVRGEDASIAIMNFGGSGIFAYNTVEDANDGIVSNWSQGIQFLKNIVINSSSGIHTDNNQNTPDIISFNTVKDCSTDGWGIGVYSSEVATQVSGNLVEKCAVGYWSARRNKPVSPIFRNNVADGKNQSGSIGYYGTTEGFGWGSTDHQVVIQNNTFINNDYGTYFLQEPGKQITVTLTSNNISNNLTAGLYYTGTATIDATNNWWGSDAGPGVGGNNGVDGGGSVTTDPFAKALATGVTGSTHEVGENGTLDSNIIVNGLYGAQLQVNHDASVLSFVSGVTHTVSSSPPWAWDQVVEDFKTTTTGRRLSGTMRLDQHTVGANLTGQSIATWTYQCNAPGGSNLTYDMTAGSGTILANKDGFAIPAALTGGVILCEPQTASVSGTIQLQGRLGTNPSPAGWNDAYVTLTCVSDDCSGYGPYTTVTDSTGHYEWVKSGPGTGIPLGTYSVSVVRRAYLGAVKSSDVTIVAGSNTIPAPTLLGGDVNSDETISIADLSGIGGAFGNSVTPDTGMDVNGDGVVNILDLVLAGGNFGLSASSW